MQRQVGHDVLGEDVARRLRIGTLDLDLHVEPAGTQDRRVDHVFAVRSADHDDVLQQLDPVDLGEQLRNDRVLHVGAHAAATGTEDRVHLVEEDDDRHALGRLLPGALEDQPDLPLGLADVLVQQLGTLDVEEERAAVALAALLLDLLGQRVGDRLGDQRLAAAGRPVEQHAFRRFELVLGEQVLVQERQLDGVLDRLDLAGEAADRGVGDVRDLFEDELLDLGLGHPLVRPAAAAVDHQRVAAAQRSVHERRGEQDDTLFIAHGR